ncbi:Nuclease harbi1, partial [Temnothorax longispinosus]
ALRFYATGNYQAVTGDLRGFSQPTVCRCIKAVSIAFAEKLHEYVQFPKTLEDQRSNIRTFYEIAEFPNVAACIDGTLIKIANPDKEIGEIFRSRKGSFSLNILAAAGPRGEILYIDVRHPGSTHDSTCFDRSALKLFFMENRIKGLLLGDNGYSCQPYLLTPVLRPLNQAERNYNKSHKKTRNLIERTFAVLWNLHIHINCPNKNVFVEVEPENAIYLDADPPRNMNGLDYRLHFIIRHFSR